MELQASLSIVDNLRQAHLEKLKVEVHLRGGKSIAGNIAAVGDHTLVLSELTGREFFGAFVRVEEITAFEVRLRKP